MARTSTHIPADTVDAKTLGPLEGLYGSAGVIQNLDLDQTVIGACPNHALLYGRLGYGENDTSVLGKC
jgi:hypothetical protein